MKRYIAILVLLAGGCSREEVFDATASARAHLKAFEEEYRRHVDSKYEVDWDNSGITVEKSQSVNKPFYVGGVNVKTKYEDQDVWWEFGWFYSVEDKKWHFSTAKEYGDACIMGGKKTKFLEKGSKRVHCPEDVAIEVDEIMRNKE